MQPPHDSPPSVARVVRCTACGAGFSTAAPRSTCPFCRAEVHFDPQAWQALHQYGERVERQHERAREQLQHVSAWKQLESDRRPSAYLVPLLVFFGFVLVGPAIGMWWLRQPSFDPAVFGIGSAILFNALAIGWSTALWIRRSRRKAEAQVSRSTHRIACPGCGAASELQAGASHHPCPYCGVALIASRTIMLRAEDAARQIARAAEMARYRAEREGMRKILRISTASVAFYMVLGYGGIPMVIVLVAATAQALRGELPWFHAALAWLAALAAASILGLVLNFFQQRRERLYAAAEDLAVQFRGRVHRDLDPFIDWLNRYWAGPYNLSLLCGSPGYLAVASEGLGYPVMLEVSLRAHDQHRPPRIQVLVAADIPEVARISRASWTDHTRAIRAYLQAQGFESHIDRAGVRLVAEHRIITHLRRRPDALHALAPILRGAVDLAVSLQGRPATHIP